MAMQALRDGAKKGVLKFFLLGILLLAAGGLIFTDVGGFFRGGVASTDVAKIGSQTLPVQQFDRTVRSSLSRLGMSPAQAYQLGYIRELLNGEIRASLIQQKAADTGIQVSTDQVAGNIRKLLEPMTQPGQRPQDVLSQLLRAQGISESQLMHSIRREMSVNMMGNAIQSGFLQASDTMARDMAAYQNEQRSVEYVMFKNADFKDVEEPGDEQLMKLYESTKESYAIPETRKSTLILIKTDALKDSLEISDEEIKEVYERNISAYSKPELRKIEQVILSDSEQAAQIAAAAQEGKALKDAVQEITGNTTDYLPAKDSEKTALLEELQDPVFTAEEGAVLGPIESGLGHHVIVLSAITAPHTTPLKKVQKDIRAELTENRLLDAQYDLANSLDDYLAAGELLETIKEDLDVEIKDLPAANRFGIGADGKAVFTSEFGPDAQDLTTSLFELGEGEASPVTELADGRMGALLVEGITEKSYAPFEEQKDALKKRWIEDSRRVQSKMRVLELMKKAQDEDAALKDLAKAQGHKLRTAKALTRTGEIKAPLNNAILGNIFEAKQGDLFAVDLEDGAAIMSVTETKLPEKLKDADPTAAQNTLLQSMQNEAYTLYITHLEKDYGVRINAKLLESVYGQQDQ